ncbi:MAG: phosphodiester glycosidase family protein [Eubacteriales bacterium]
MKRFLHRATAMALTVSLLASNVVATNLGSWTWNSSVELGDTVDLSQGQFYGSGYYQTESVVEFSPDDGLIPMVAYGNTLYGRSTMDYLTDYVENQGYSPVAAINGSFFDLTTGIPYGAVVTDGIVRVSGTTSAVGFFADGSTIIGSPNIALEITIPDGSVVTGHLNREMTTASGIAVFSRDYDYTTKDYQDAYNIVLTIQKGNFALGETVELQVSAIYADTQNCEIPENSVVMAMDNNTQFTYTLDNTLKSLAIGDTVTIGTTVDEDWEDVQYICGGDDMLVENGKAVTDFSLVSAEKRTGRTAIGIKADGTTVLYAVDGLQSGYSTGISLADLATRMKELGCVTALNLDGGGSTTVGGHFLGYSDLETLNSPSDGKQRECANFIFLVRETTTAKSADKLHLYPYDAILLGGATLDMTVTATDSNDMATDVPSNMDYFASSGTMDETGTFTADFTAETVTVSAESAKAEGSTTVKVIETPSAMTVKNQATNSAVTAVTVTGEGTADFTATAVLYGADVVSQDNCYTWQVDEHLGTVDENGLFTAVSTATTLVGNLTVTAGELSKTIAITVGAQLPDGSVLEPMETAVLTSGDGITASLNESRTYMKYGDGSGRLDYDLTDAEDGYVTASISVEIPSAYKEIGMWVYGDGSNNSLSAYFTVDGVATSKWLTQLNFTGWKQVTATMPAGATAMTSLKVVTYEEATASIGTIYIDQIFGSTLPLKDVEPPVIAMELVGTNVEMTVTDSGSGVASTTLRVDGDVTEFSGTWAVPLDGGSYQIRLEAVDYMGNQSAMSMEVIGDSQEIFVDTTGHWAETYINYAYDQGYLKGSTNTAGQLEFRPDNAMTRQEFAVALIGFLGVDTAQYADVDLPFADGADIASWALDSYKAANSLGLITGSQDKGALYGNPNATITRQEAMAILSRTQSKGYALADLTQFTDSGNVDTWAYDDIASMVTQGVISGTTDGKLEPSATVTRAQVAKMLKMLY